MLYWWRADEAARLHGLLRQVLGGCSGEVPRQDIVLCAAWQGACKSGISLLSMSLNGLMDCHTSGQAQGQPGTKIPGDGKKQSCLHL